MISSENTPSNRGRLARIGLVVVSIGLLICAAYWAGRFHEFLIAGRARQDREIALIEAFLKKHPDQYRGVIFNRGPAPEYLLEGRVDKPAELVDLKAEVARLLGQARMEDVVAVEVSAGP